MKLTRLATLATAIVLAMLTMVFGQATPDFSGTWKLNADDAPLAPPPPPPPQTLALTIAQTPAELRVERLMAAGERQLVQKFVYKLDGSESLNQMGPLTSRSTAAWDGPKLVITSVLSVDGRPLGDSKEVYSLDGSTLVVEYNRTTPASTITGRSTYRKSL